MSIISIRLRDRVARLWERVRCCVVGKRWGGWVAVKSCQGLVVVASSALNRFGRHVMHARPLGVAPCANCLSVPSVVCTLWPHGLFCQDAAGLVDHSTFVMSQLRTWKVVLEALSLAVASAASATDVCGET